MSIEVINEQLLRSVGVGIALFDAETLALEFANDVFLSWFPPVDDEDGSAQSLDSLFPELEKQAMRASIREDKRFGHEHAFKRKRRTLILDQHFSLARLGKQDVIVLECQNITRIRELESMIDSYSRMVERNTREIQREKQQVEKLLLNIMPRAAYEEYQEFGIVSPQRYESCTVLVLDFINFANAVNTLPPATLVSELNELFSAFDRISEQFGCERIRTAGDSYRCMAGMHESEDDHLAAVGKAATRFLRYIEHRNNNATYQWHCRIGIGSGSVVGSIIGNQKYVFDVFGEAVDAARACLAQACGMEILLDSQAMGDPIDGLRIEQAGNETARKAGRVRLTSATPN